MMADPHIQPPCDMELPKGHEIVDGALVRKAMPNIDHGSVQLALGAALVPYRKTWVFGSEVQVLFEPGQTFLPDLAGWRRDRGEIPERGSVPVTVAPHWVCEILSESTAFRDRGTKQNTYHRAGVEHYWLLDPLARSLIVMRWKPKGWHVLAVEGQSSGQAMRGEAAPERSSGVAIDLIGDEVVYAPPFADVALALSELFAV